MIITDHYFQLFKERQSTSMSLSSFHWITSLIFS